MHTDEAAGSSRRRSPRPVPTPELHVVVGLPGAGKTTRARALATQHRAIRLNPDEWMTALTVDLYDEPFRARLEHRLTQLATDLLATGTDVVIEYGSWSRPERDALLAMGRAAAAHVELHVLNPPLDELWRRLTTRNHQPGQAPIDRPTLESYVPHWHPPTQAELSTYDAHHTD